MIDGVCPECSGAVEATLEVCADHVGDAPVCPNCGRGYESAARFLCTVCKFSTGGPPGALVAQHPAVIAFYYDRGVDLQYGLDYAGVKAVIDLVSAHRETVVSADPPRVRVTVAYAGDERSLVLDERAMVVDVED